MSTSLTKADTYDVQYVAQQGAKIKAITDEAGRQIAGIGVSAVNAMAYAVSAADQTRRQLMDSGHRSEIYDDGQSKTLQVTGTNIITLANTAQKEILQEATRMMR